MIKDTRKRFDDIAAVVGGFCIAVIVISTIAMNTLASTMPSRTQDVAECNHPESIRVVVVREKPALCEAISDNPSGKYSSIGLSDEERTLVALTAYHEARGEGVEGMQAVIEVVFNRMLSERWPSTAKDVIYAPGQFCVASYLLTANINEPELLTQAFDLVREVLETTEYILPDGYVYFATSKVNGKDFIQIGNHYFSK